MKQRTVRPTTCCKWNVSHVNNVIELVKNSNPFIKSAN